VKGIILAGGRGTRLHPITISISKQLLPVYNKPMIYYPLSMLMLAGIREILVITMPDQQRRFRELLGDGNKWGLDFSYAVQAEPRGLGDAFLVGSEFVSGQKVCLILGDNIFFGHNLSETLRRSAALDSGAVIFACKVRDAQRYGVVEFDERGFATSIEEKPDVPLTSYAVPGMYFYDERVLEFASQLVPSSRGELEITDLNQKYMEMGELRVEVLGRGVVWLDAGTHDSLLQAATFVQTLEERQGMMISCPEEIAYRMGFIDRKHLHVLAEAMSQNAYGQYLLQLADQRSE
jgi:glucose-1-phosphate thymidylyltransferase